MAINTFRKDSTERINPLIRALAVRTMGCIPIEQMAEYLIGPLSQALNDEDAYVRKTAAICVAKVYETSASRVE
jgi:AP-1 complex subunit beta-1